MASKPINIGLLWHSANSGNLGVGALTVANLVLARQAAADVGLQPNFLIIGMRDRDPAYIEGAGVFGVDARRLLSPSGCWSVLGAQDCVLDIGAGDSFADIYGFKRFLYLWLTKVIALARGVPLLLSPQTIGPFMRSPYKQMAALALGRSRTVLARDRLSFDATRQLAPKAHAVLATDVAFALPYDDCSAQRGGARIKVGVNVSGLLFNEAESGNNRFGLQVNYAELMRRFIENLAARPDVEVHLITHAIESPPGRDDDSGPADMLMREFPSVIRVPNFRGPSEAKSYISGLDFLVAGRMHACIAAFSAGVPVVPVTYSRKFSGLFGTLGYSWMVPVTGSDTDAALDYLNDCLARREEVAADVAAGLGKVDVLLDAYRAELRSLFASVAKVQ